MESPRHQLNQRCARVPVLSRVGCHVPPHYGEVGNGCDAACQLEAPDCSDGFDNDGDGLVDYGLAPTNDPGCGSPLTVRENPQSSNGVDDDLDGQVDYPADTKCKNVKDNDERTDPPCGLGAELAFVMALLGLAASRRRRAR